MESMGIKSPADRAATNSRSDSQTHDANIMYHNDERDKQLPYLSSDRFAMPQRRSDIDFDPHRQRQTQQYVQGMPQHGEYNRRHPGQEHMSSYDGARESPVDSGRQHASRQGSPPAYESQAGMQMPFRPQHTSHAFASSNSAPATESAFKSETSPTSADDGEFSSPFAHTPDWSPTDKDLEMAAIPAQSFQVRIKQRFARSPGSVFDKPAPSFTRPVPHALRNSAADFPPCSIPGKGPLKGDGFKPLYPGQLLACRDVSLADWQRFLEDLEVAGRLGGAQQIISNVAPLTMHLGLTGYFVTKAIEKGMRKKKEPIVSETVEVWQDTFFAPRGLRVCIRGGPDDDTNPAQGRQHHQSDESDSAEGDVGRVHGNKGSHRDKQKARRADKRDREEQKGAKKSADKRPFSLVISPT